MLTAIIPDPHGPDFRAEIHGDDANELTANIRQFIAEMCYGASDIGAKFNVYRDGVRVATAMYNGKFHWADPLYDPAHPEHTIEV